MMTTMHHRFRFTASRFAATEQHALIAWLRDGLIDAVPEADIGDETADGRGFWLDFAGDRYWIYASHTLGAEFLAGIEGRKPSFGWTQSNRPHDRADSLIAALRMVILRDTANSLQSEEDD